MNPFEGLAQYFLGRLEQKIFQGWARLFFQMGMSATISFLLICGGTLVATESLLLSIGTGMITVALVLTVFFRTSKLTAGMSLVLPAEEATKELNTDFEVITKPDLTKSDQEKKL